MNLAEVAEAAPRALLLAVVGFLFSLLAVVCFFLGASYLGLVQQGTLLGWIMCGAIVGGASSLIIMPVITSYSIHYTKLYDYRSKSS